MLHASLACLILSTKNADVKFLHGRNPWMVVGEVVERWGDRQPKLPPFCIVEVYLEFAVHDGFDILLHISIVGAALVGCREHNLHCL